MDAAQTLLKTNLEREKKLKLLRENPKENSTEISKILLLLRKDYQQLIVEHTAFSCNGGKDIDGILWKQCFYRQIEEYRRSIRKTVQLLDQNERDGGGHTHNPAMIEKARTHLAKLTAAFAKFLSDSAIFYQELMLQLEGRFKTVSHDGRAVETIGNSTEEGLRDDYLRCISRCLLYLGDIARYKELYAERREKDYTEADRYYSRAAFMLPYSGNPQNQLAVLATYTDNEFVAVYHYCRSVMVQQPFAAGVENLVVLFDKNGRLYKQLKSGEGQQQLIDSLSHIADKNKKAIAFRVKTFLIMFVRLHGVLFGWTRRAVKLMANENDHQRNTAVPEAQQEEALPAGDEAGPAAAAAASASKPIRPEDLAAFNAEGFREMCQSVLEEFDSLLAASAFGETLLVRMLVLCIFSVHEASRILSSSSTTTAATTTGRNDTNYNRESDESDHRRDAEASTASRSLSESLALFLTFGLVNKVAKRVGTIWDTAEGSSKLRVTAVKALLPILSIFAEWLTVHQPFLLTAESSADEKGSSETEEVESSAGPSSSSAGAGAPAMSARNAIAANTDTLRAESRARSSLRSALSALKDPVEICIRAHAGPSGSESKKVDVRGKPLREHIELRGFLPLAAQYELFFEGVESLVNKLPTVPDEIARDRRLRVLRTFMKNWPDGVAPASSSRNANKVKQLSRERSGGMLKLTPEMSGALNRREKNREKKPREKRKSEDRRGGGGRERRARDVEDDPDYDRSAYKPTRRERRAMKAAMRENSGGLERADIDFGKLQRKRETRARDDGSRDDGEDMLPEEEFPPLPGSREPSRATPAVISYATSALFNHSAPTGANPFGSDTEDDDDDDSGDDDEDDSEDDDDDDEDSREADDAAWGNNDSPNAIARELGIGFRSTMPPTFTAEIDADEVFNGGNNHVSLAGLLGQRSGSAMSAGATSGLVGRADPLLDDDDDDFADDVVVFKPAFSRVFNSSPATKASADDLVSLGIRGVNSLGNFDVGSGTSGGTFGASSSGKGDWWNTSPSLKALASPDASGISGLDLGISSAQGGHGAGGILSSSSSSWWNENPPVTYGSGAGIVGIADTAVPIPPVAVRGPPAVPFMASSSGSGKAVPPPPGFTQKPPTSASNMGDGNGDTGGGENRHLWTANPFYRPAR